MKEITIFEDGQEQGTITLTEDDVQKLWNLVLEIVGDEV